MTNEEFQKIVIEELRGLNSKVDRLGEGQERLEQRQSNLEQGQIKLEERQSNLEQGQIKLEERQSSLEERQSNLEQGQTGIIQRLDNIEKDLKAVIDQTADLTEFRQETREEFNDLKTVVSRIEVATAQNWSDIAKLRSVKFL